MRIALFGFVLTFERDMNAVQRGLIINKPAYEVNTIEGGIPKWYVKKLFKDKPASFVGKNLNDIECLQEKCMMDFGSYPSIEYCQKILGEKK